MFKKNMGRLDRGLRFIFGAALLLIGLIPLDGLHGSSTGVYLAVFALLPLLTSLAGICPAYWPFGISTLERKTRTDS